MATYGYIRVSTDDQSFDRQLPLFREYITDERFIITDKASGRNFDRKGYNMLVGTDKTAPLLREGDMLIIASLDRLGRDYTEICKQWTYITQTLKADIKVLDMPLLDTSRTKDLDGRFIADLVLKILSYVAEKERENIRRRQRQGIYAAKANGKHLGRPQAKYPAEWDNVYAQWKKQEITADAAMKKMNLKRTTFYKLVKLYEQQ